MKYLDSAQQIHRFRQRQRFKTTIGRQLSLLGALCLAVFGMTSTIFCYAQQGTTRPLSPGSFQSQNSRLIGGDAQAVGPFDASPSGASTQAGALGGISSNGSSVSPAAQNYILTYNDVVNLKVYQEPDLDSTVRIAKDGMVNLPLVGTVRLGGLTVQEAARYIRELLAKDYLVNPQLNLSITEYSKRQFTILGEVQRPGSYLMTDDKPLTLQQAIAVAGGFTPNAKKNKITITRFTGDTKSLLRVDAGALAKDKDAKPVLILPDDQITVHESFF